MQIFAFHFFVPYDRILIICGTVSKYAYQKKNKKIKFQEEEK